VLSLKKETARIFLLPLGKRGQGGFSYSPLRKGAKNGVTSGRKVRLIIEVDGYTHQYQKEKDTIRDRRLQELGFLVVRIPEGDIMYDLDNVIRTLEFYLPEEIITRSPYPPCPRGNQEKT